MYRFKRILIVEDDKLLNKTLTCKLTSDGYEITPVFNAKAAAGKLMAEGLPLPFMPCREIQLCYWAALH